MISFKALSLYLLRCGVGLGLVGWLAYRAEWESVILYFSSMQLWELVIVFGLSLASLGVQFLRWKNLVESNSVHFARRDLVPSFFAGFTLRLMAPGGHAEVGKIFLMPGKKRGKVFAYGMDKMYQTFVKLVVMAGGVFFVFPEYWIYSFTALVLAIGGVVFLPTRKLLTSRQEKKVNNRRLLLQTCLYSLGVVGIMIVQYHVLLNRMQPISWGHTALSVIYLWGSAVIAISISGLGVREWVAAYSFSWYGIQPSYAVSTSLFVFAINCVLPALVGAYFIYAKRRHLRDVGDSIEAGWALVRSSGASRLWRSRQW